MATEIKIEIILRETVKPSSPTPENHERHELSLIDQFSPTTLIPLLLFYPRATHRTTISETSQILTRSLSQTLTRFHHFAGRLRDNTAIECNDAGAEFVAARVNCPLSTILANPDNATLTKFVHVAVPEDQSLLVVRANFFDCGALAIGVSLSHKAADASTLSTFLTCWASEVSKPEIEPALIPQYVSSETMFPPLESSVSFLDVFQVNPEANERIVLKRVVFTRQGIKALKRSAAGNNNSAVRNPTRVEAVSALIWKCAIEALSGESKSGVHSSSFIQAVNIRKRMSPSLPDNSVGNLIWIFQAKTPIGDEEDKTELEDLVGLLQNGIDELKSVWKAGIRAETLSGFVGEMSGQKGRGGVHQLTASSWCRFPLYGTDFGWGKPVWICMPDTINTKNMCVMMDSRDGEGIEASLMLGEEEMKRFQTNPELLAFACLDPAVIV